MALKEIVYGLGKLVGKESPHILTALGIGSFITGAVMAAKVAPMANPEIEKALEQRKEMIERGATKTEAAVEAAKEIAENAAPLYLGAFGMCVLGIVCVVAADRIHVKRNTALLAAYTVSERALDIYQSKVIEKLGEGKHEKVLDSIAEDDCPFDDDKKTKTATIIDDEGVLCYDHVTGRYFQTKVESIRAAEAAIIKRLLDETVVSLNDFYTELGLDDVSVIGEVLGWDASRVKPDIHFTSMLDSKQVPCLVINYRTCIINGHLL